MRTKEPFGALCRLCSKISGLGVWGQVSHIPLSCGIVWRGGLPVNLPHANASTVAAIRDAKAGKVNCKELEGSRRW
jgi:hypothetical protein